MAVSLVQFSLAITQKEQIAILGFYVVRFSRVTVVSGLAS